MFTVGVPIVQTIASHLNQLLLQARKIKTTTNVIPPLQAFEFEKNISHIEEVLSGIKPSEESKYDATLNYSAFENASREVFYGQLARYTIDSEEFVNVWNLLDLIQFFADKGLCDAVLVLLLIEELLDSQTIDGCRRVFDYLEPRRNFLITNNYSQSKQLTVLRSCNELLRRLSRAEDTVFCGRVYIFMFQSFPLGDKSAVNLRGTYHVENTTVFDHLPEKIVAENQQMEVDSVPETKAQPTNGQASPNPTEADKSSSKPSQPILMADVTEENTKEDAESMEPAILYPTFWSLQEVFSNPPKIFNPPVLESFKKGLELTLQKFKSMPKTFQSKNTPTNTDPARVEPKRKRHDSHDEFANNFNPKYLTSRDLFELELSDLTFQRHILVQALILMDFLLSLTSTAKARLTHLKAQKSMSYEFTLSEEDAKWATNMRQSIALYLQEGPDGKFYFRMVDNVLSRDKGWVSWKAESCPAIAKPPISPEEFVTAIKGAKKASASKRLRPTPLGTMDLSFLSEVENAAGMEKLKNPVRYTRPALDLLVKEVEMADSDMATADSVEKQTLLPKKQNATWRGLRIASKTRLRMFDKIEDGKPIDVLLAPRTEPNADPPAALDRSVTSTRASSEANGAASANGLDENQTGDAKSEQQNESQDESIGEQLAREPSSKEADEEVEAMTAGTGDEEGEEREAAAEAAAGAVIEADEVQSETPARAASPLVDESLAEIDQEMSEAQVDAGSGA